MPSVRDLIVSTARRAPGLQRPDGSFPPGHNGPWGNVDTPARVTSHWLVLLTAAHRLTGEQALRDAAARAGGFLVSPALRPGGCTFHCCVSDCPWTASNGLIGQAWVMEGLLEAAEHLDGRYLAPLVELLRRYPFDADLGLWHNLGLGGEVGPVHRTLNQQVWFSVMAYRVARAAGDAALGRQARRHFECLPRLVLWRDRYLDMLVREWPLHKGSWKRFLAAQLPKLRNPLEEYREARRVREQSVGYLSFTLYGLARMFALAPDLPLWGDEDFRAMLRRSVAFADDMVFRLPPSRNQYAFSYNPAGIEMAYVKQAFGDLAGGTRAAPGWLAEQLRRHLDGATGLMTRDTGDPNILSARAYELHVLKDGSGQ